VPSSSGLQAPDAALARHQARQVLAERRFHVAPIPRPLHGVLHAIGRALESPLEAIEELVRSLGAGVPGGTAVVWAALAALVLAIGGLATIRHSRRALAEPDGRGSDESPSPMSARELERAAAVAERELRYAEAVRLHFCAGLERLAEREVVELVTSTPNSVVSRTLSSERFDTLARSFDEITYGGRVAQAEDVQSARGGWHDLLESLPARARPARATEPRGAAAAGP
jgi:hypothetical protein